jgi:predicted tellurium resistance membrane protein TerC
MNIMANPVVLGRGIIGIIIGLVIMYFGLKDWIKNKKKFWIIYISLALIMIFIGLVMGIYF